MRCHACRVAVTPVQNRSTYVTKEWQKSLAAAAVHERHSIPLVKLEYRLTERTRFQFGMQGFGQSLPYEVTDLVNPEVDFEQTDTVLMATNDSQYFGYLVTTTFGLNNRKKEFSDPVIIDNEKPVAESR